MKQPPIIQTAHELQRLGKSIREISRLLSMSRNTVRKLLRNNVTQDHEVTFKNEQEQELVMLIQSQLQSCRGNLVRVHEIITQEYHYDLAYSSLTWLVRKHELKESSHKKRFGEYVYDPGVEMQHDTSPHYLEINGKKVKAQCASLIFGFSRKLFIQYYPCFTRFEAKAFLSEALSFMQGSCQRCVIDNTSVILAGGAGIHAVVAPEMVFFSRVFGFTFIAHAVNDANRKGKIERPFYYAETNFLAGRIFTDWRDLNRQARLWCETVANAKPKRALGTSPDAAFIQEKSSLIRLPEVLPPVYKNYQRVVDTQGFIHVDTNRYSVPEKYIGRTMDVYQYLEHIDIFHQHRPVTTHSRMIGVRDRRAVIAGHHPKINRAKKQNEISEAERQLTGHTPILDDYLFKLKSHVRGRGGWAFKQLLQLKQTYPMSAFMVAITQASRYGLYDMKRLETMILKQINNDFFNL